MYHSSWPCLWLVGKGEAEYRRVAGMVSANLDAGEKIRLCGVPKNRFMSYSETDEEFIRMFQHTNLPERYGKKRLVLESVQHGRNALLAWMLENRYLRTWNAVEEALKEAQAQKNAAASAMLLEYRRQKGMKPPRPRSMNPMAAENLRREWGTKILEDGTLIITSYKGTPEPGTVLRIPDHIGKRTVTALCSNLFSASNSANICEIHVPGTIACIPSGFVWFSKSLRRVVLGDGVRVVEEDAFLGNGALEEIVCEGTNVVMQHGAVCPALVPKVGSNAG